MIRKIAGLLAVTAVSFALMNTASAAAIIQDGNVKLGVDELGQLNIGGSVPSVSGITAVGMRYLPDGAGGDEYETTSQGCFCEGWGVAADGLAAWANNASGSLNLVQDSFASDGMSATVVTSTTNGLPVRVTHAFALSGDTPNLYEIVVTIEALADVTDVRYRRVMDWDTDPTPFNEYVTIGGTAAATAVLAATNDGFSSANPLSSNTAILPCGTGDFVDCGPSDHGANFDFGFGDLAQGESTSFSIFYGGALSVADAFATMAAAGIEVYSLGRSGTDADGDGFADGGDRRTPTFIFGFKGVGGTSVGVPEPGTLLLFGTALLGMGATHRRRRKV